MSDHDFLRLLFISILSFQYHPRNNVPPDLDIETINRALVISCQAADRFNQFLADTDNIPF